MWFGIVTRIVAHLFGGHAPACRGRYCHPDTPRWDPVANYWD